VTIAAPTPHTVRSARKVGFDRDYGKAQPASTRIVVTADGVQHGDDALSGDLFNGFEIGLGHNGDGAGMGQDVLRRAGGIGEERFRAQQKNCRGFMESCERDGRRCSVFGYGGGETRADGQMRQARDHTFGECDGEQRAEECQTYERRRCADARECKQGEQRRERGDRNGDECGGTARRAVQHHGVVNAHTQCSGDDGPQHAPCQRGFARDIFLEVLRRAHEVADQQRQRRKQRHGVVRQFRRDEFENDPGGDQPREAEAHGRHATLFPRGDNGQGCEQRPRPRGEDAGQEIGAGRRAVALMAADQLGQKIVQHGVGEEVALRAGTAAARHRN
jgi:hypothetical protein